MGLVFLIQFVNVSKAFDNKTLALRDISIRIEKGEFAFLVGASGAGKSTLIRLLLKMEEPTKGHILVGNRSIGRLNRKETALLRRNVGVVFQDYSLLNEMTVFENVAFTLQVMGCSSKEIREKVLEVLELVGLLSKRDNFPLQLAGGEQQRVAIARAIVNRPQILLADEPTGNLDPNTAWEIIEIMNGINKWGTTVVMATHAAEIVDKLRKRVIVLDKGQLTRDEERGAYCREA